MATYNFAKFRRYVGGWSPRSTFTVHIVQDPEGYTIKALCGAKSHDFNVMGRELHPNHLTALCKTCNAIGRKRFGSPYSLPAPTTEGPPDALNMRG